MHQYRTRRDCRDRSSAVKDQGVTAAAQLNTSQEYILIVNKANCLLGYISRSKAS